MKFRIVAYALLMCGISVQSAVGQKFDQERMDRDLAVAEDILISLLKSESEDVMFFSTGASSTYLPDYGVMFNLMGSGHLIGEDFGRGFSFSFSDDDCDGCDYVYDYRGNRMDEEDDEDEDDEDVQVRVNNISINSRGGARSEKIVRKAMKTFLADYADLIGQLEADHKILISSAGNRWDFGPVSIGSGTGKKISAEITKKDISSFKSGKINRSQLIDKIKITEGARNAKKATDLELLKTILKRLYKPDLSDTYYVSDPIYYDRLENFGVIYKMKVYSSTSDRDGEHTITTLGLSGLSSDERNRKVEALYPKFEKDLTENILEYGKTIRSLNDDEMLIFKVKLTQCKGCDMPKSIELSVKQSVLSAYNSGKMNKSTALSKFNLKKTNN